MAPAIARRWADVSLRSPFQPRNEPRVSPSGSSRSHRGPNGQNRRPVPQTDERPVPFDLPQQQGDAGAAAPPQTW